MKNEQVELLRHYKRLEAEIASSDNEMKSGKLLVSFNQEADRDQKPCYWRSLTFY